MTYPDLEAPTIHADSFFIQDTGSHPPTEEGIRARWKAVVEFLEGGIPGKPGPRGSTRSPEVKVNGNESVEYSRVQKTDKGGY